LVLDQEAAQAASTKDFHLIRTEKNGDRRIFAIKYGPINYYGKPEFVYPLTFNLLNLQEEYITIDYNGKQRACQELQKLDKKNVRNINDEV